MNDMPNEDELEAALLWAATQKTLQLVSDERLDSFVQWQRSSYSPSEVQAIARELQERREAEPTFTSVVHDCCVTAEPITALCARYNLTIEGVVELVNGIMDEERVFFRESEVADHASWVAGVHDALDWVRRLAREEKV